MQQDRADQPAVLGSRQDLRAGRAHQAVIGVGAVAVVQHRFAKIDHVGDGLVRGTEDRADIGAEHALDACVRSSNDGPLTDVVEQVGRADRHAGRTAHALARIDHLTHEEVVRLEAAAIDLGAPGERPLGRRRVAFDQGSVAAENGAGAGEIRHIHWLAVPLGRGHPIMGPVRPVSRAAKPYRGSPLLSRDLSRRDYQRPRRRLRRCTGLAPNGGTPRRHRKSDSFHQREPCVST